MDKKKKEDRRSILGYPVKAVSRLTPSQYARAKSICKKYGFKSVYEINQYLWACFLRVADPLPDDDKDEMLPDEIKEMFSDLSQAERHFEYVKPKRRAPQYEIDKKNGQLSLWKDLKS